MEKELKRIVLIGPVYPFKGGIAHYDAMLCEALRKRYDVRMISYKMLYPKFLFKKPQRDETDRRFAVDDTEYLLNSANPVNIARVARKIRQWKPDLVILPWWHPYFAPCYLLLNLFLPGIRKLFICHNVFPHERFPLDKALTRCTLATGDAFIVHSRQDLKDLQSIRHTDRAVLNPHPTYEAFRSGTLTKAQARELLGCTEQERILLFFGFVRPYKGLIHLLRAMPDIIQSCDHVKLLIVGDFDEQREMYFNFIRQHQLEGHVQVVEGYVPDSEVERYFEACDLVVLPYESATQSGIVQIAYGFHKPVVVTDVGGLPDVVTDGQTGYVVPERDSAAIAEAVTRFFASGAAASMEQAIVKEEDRFSWDHLVRVLEQLCYGGNKHE